MQTLKKTLGHRIRTLRRSRDMTQEELAAAAKLHTTYIAKIEIGDRLPTLDTLVTLANALDVSIVRIVSVLDKPEGSGAWSQDAERERILDVLDGCSAHELRLIRELAVAVKRVRET